MKSYFDSSVLLKTYVEEPNSHEADALVEESGTPILYTHLQVIEVATAIRLKRFRKEITEAQEKAALVALESDIVSGRMQRPDCELSAIFHQAAKLSAKYAAQIGVRTMDILHVAAALKTDCTTLVSFDKRQRKLAKSVGLKLKP